MKYLDTIQSYTNLFLNTLALQAQIEVKYEKAEDIYQVNLISENPGLLIGRHGESLSALKTLLVHHLKAKTGEWLNLALNVNDYWQRREESLRLMADGVVKQVLVTGQPHVLPPMPANERRFVHLYLSTNDKVLTESDGEGRSRSVVVSPK